MIQLLVMTNDRPVLWNLRNLGSQLTDGTFFLRADVSAGPKLIQMGFDHSGTFQRFAVRKRCIGFVPLFSGP